MKEVRDDAHGEAPLPLHYRTVGDSGDWVLLLHGLFGAGDNLGALARALADGFRVVQVDLRNHGRSPHSAAMTFAAMAADIALLQDTLGIGSSHVVGHSLGGRVAMQLALHHAARVRRLVVADIAPVAYAPHHTQILAGLEGLDLATVSSRGGADAQLAQSIPELAVRQFLLKSLYQVSGGNVDAGKWRWRFNLPALRACYADITVAQDGAPFAGPTLFVRGGLSDYILPAYESIIQRLFPHCAIETIAGAGHWLHGEKPAEFNRLVREFLAKK